MPSAVGTTAFAQKRALPSSVTGVAGIGTGNNASASATRVAPGRVTSGLSDNTNQYISKLRNINDNFGQQQAAYQQAAIAKRDAFAAQKAAAEANNNLALGQKDFEAFKNNASGWSDPRASQTGSGAYLVSNNGGTGARSDIVNAAMSLQGSPYAWGGGGYGNSGSRGTGLGTQNVVGVDCSGLTSYAYSAAGIKIPRYSKNQVSMGYRTKVSNLKPGDLVGWYNGSGGVKGHVALYVGNGYMMEASRPGTKAHLRKVYGNAFGVHLSLPGD